jgi:hypothetical protein
MYISREEIAARDSNQLPPSLPPSCSVLQMDPELHPNYIRVRAASTDQRANRRPHIDFPSAKPLARASAALGGLGLSCGFSPWGNPEEDAKGPHETLPMRGFIWGQRIWGLVRFSLGAFSDRFRLVWMGGFFLFDQLG